MLAKIKSRGYRERHFFLGLLIGVLVLGACKEEDPAPSENRRVNTWILENMRNEYYWNDQIPRNPNMEQDPMQFFESILSEEDRFSWIQENADELTDNLAGRFESFGYEVKLYYLRDGEDDVGAVVLYTYEGSPAEDEGLERGMWIGKLNGNVLNDQNYEALFDTRREQVLGVGHLDEEGNFIEEEEITVAPTVIQENPIQLDSIYEFGGTIIGYLAYTSFIPGPAGSDEGLYDQDLMQIFSRFKARGVNEMILDLRYNLGGDVGSSFRLAGYLMKGYEASNIFAIYEPNTKQKYPFAVGEFYEEGEVPPNLGTLDRLYVLISDQTASASEMIINGLKPYMEVVLVGDAPTVGKNVASTTIVDTRDVPESEKIKYGLQPIVLKIYNSRGESDFENGFTPDIEATENFLAFGNLSESFLAAAVEEITGMQPQVEALAERAPRRAGELFNSLTRKPGGGRMYVDRSSLPEIQQ